MASSFNNRLAKLLLKQTTLKSCKNIKFQFNPWHDNAKSIRDVYSRFYSPKFRITNDKCMLSADIRSDNSQPQMEVTFIDDTKAFFKTEALTTYDIVKEFNRISALKAPKESTD